MQDLRELIQSKFNEISVLESGPPIPDSVVEEGKTYFGYELSEDFLDSDMDSNYVMQVSIKDVTMDNNIRKILVTGNVKYNELLKK